MYVPSQFEAPSTDAMHELIRQHPLAAVIANGAEGLVANHIPLLLLPKANTSGVLQGHIARANPMWKQIGEASSVLAIFQGGQHYITPQWYPSKQSHGKVVPTWNYAVVHVHGVIRWRQEPDWLLAMVTALTNQQEAATKAPWQVSDAPPDYISKMLDAIIGFEIEISEMIGKWKVSQNRNEADQQGVVEGLKELGTDASLAMSKEIQTQRLNSND